MRNPHLDSQTIRRKVLHLLTRRDYTPHEIRQKMLAKGFDPETIETVLLQLTASGLLDEDRFIENFIYAAQCKGHGPLRIAAALKIKGITTEKIAKQLEMADNAWLDHAYAVWRKHFKNTPPEDSQSKNKQQRFLQYRGFTWEQIQSVFNRIGKSNHS